MLQHGFNTEADDRRSTSCWTPPSALPEATEDDRLLVQATQAAIDAASHEFDSNVSDGDYDDDEVDKRRPSRSLKGRFRSFLRSVLSSGGGARDRLNASNSATAEIRRQKKSGGGCTRRRRGNQESGGSARLENASNTEQAPPTPQRAEEAQQQKTENNEGAEPKDDEPQDEQLVSTPQSQPSPTEQSEEQSPISAYPPIQRPRVFRGGPTTEGHKRTQDILRSECRVIPIATLYKKVAMVPGRGRLFLSAPNNPRPMGSQMLYDIAYENCRHHSDCNRDFARSGLKKICPSYCKPSQFRYVY